MNTWSTDWLHSQKQVLRPHLHLHLPNATTLLMHLDACVMEEFTRADTTLKRDNPACSILKEERGHPLIIEEYSSRRIIPSPRTPIQIPLNLGLTRSIPYGPFNRTHG